MTRPPDTRRTPGWHTGGSKEDHHRHAEVEGDGTGPLRQPEATSSTHRRGALVIYTERREMVLGATIDKSLRDELVTLGREHPWHAVRRLSRELVELLDDCQRMTFDHEGNRTDYAAVYEGATS